MKSLLSLVGISISLLTILTVSAFACPILQDPSFKQISTQSYNIALNTIPEEIVVGEPFAVDLWVCDKTGSAFDGEVIANAMMPLHKHGMNYEPSIKAFDNGKFHLDGFVLHMQGKWQFIFDLRRDGRSETVSLDHILK